MYGNYFINYYKLYYEDVNYLFDYTNNKVVIIVKLCCMQSFAVVLGSTENQQTVAITSNLNIMIILNIAVLTLKFPICSKQIVQINYKCT